MSLLMPTLLSAGPNHGSLSVILKLVGKPEFTFTEFSTRVLDGVITDGDARLVAFKRFREESSTKQKFVSLQLETRGRETCWLRIARVHSKPWFFSMARSTSYDTVGEKPAYVRKC